MSPTPRAAGGGSRDSTDAEEREDGCLLGASEVVIAHAPLTEHP